MAVPPAIGPRAVGVVLRGTNVQPPLRGISHFVLQVSHPSLSHQEKNK